MTNVISALTARTQFGQILRRVKQKNERFLVGRRGEPQAVIIGIDDYINTFAPTPAWLKAIGAEAKRKGLSTLTMRQIDAEITTARRAPPKYIAKQTERLKRRALPDQMIRVVLDTNVIVSAYLNDDGQHFHSS
jgi:prevent-host-death family protein